MAKSKTNVYRIEQSKEQGQRIGDALRILGLEGMRASYGQIAELALHNSQMTPHDYLESLLERELVWKEDNRLQRWTQTAKFPKNDTLDSFDFSFQPSIDKRLIYELASCRFIERDENVIFFGPSGVGKTHLAVSLGNEAIQKGYEVRFLTLSHLIDLFEKHANGEAHRVLTTLLRPKLLILDEMDMYDINSTVSTLLFRLLIQRYEKSSTIFTSQKDFSEWAKLFGSPHRADAIIDRINHHAHIINIQGDSYRVKRKR